VREQRHVADAELERLGGRAGVAHHGTRLDAGGAQAGGRAELQRAGGDARLPGLRGRVLDPAGGSTP
jgi:hypothetical protein